MSIVRDEITDHLADLERFARSLVGYGHEADAADLVHDCVERALRRADQFEDGTNLRAWLFTLLRNIFISRKRHELVKRRHAEAVARAPMPTQQPPQMIHVMLNETAEAMALLSPREAATIRDLAVQEQAHAIVAQRHGIPVGTVKSRLSRTRAKLRGLMAMEDDNGIDALAA